jgi:hypothetical protein
LSREVEEAIRAWIKASHEASKTPPPPERLGGAERDRTPSTMGEEKGVEWFRLVVCPLCRRIGLLYVRVRGVKGMPEVYVLHVREGEEVRCDLSLF